MSGNPYHDQRGRFTSGDRVGGGIVKMPKNSAPGPQATNVTRAEESTGKPVAISLQQEGSRYYVRTMNKAGYVQDIRAMGKGFSSKREAKVFATRQSAKRGGLPVKFSKG